MGRGVPSKLKDKKQYSLERLREMCRERGIELPGDKCQTETCLRLLFEWKKKKLRARAAKIRREKSKDSAEAKAAEAYVLQGSNAECHICSTRVSRCTPNVTRRT
jgi:hypothetical protein